MRITNHGKRRLRKRFKIKGETQTKQIAQVLAYGIGMDSAVGSVRAYLYKVFSNGQGNNIRIYNEKVFIFGGETLITTFPLPYALRATAAKLQKKVMCLKS